MSGGVTPVFRRRDQAALDRVIVQILQLLQHRLVAQDGLRMHAFLPDLVLAGSFMRGAVVAELVGLLTVTPSTAGVVGYFFSLGDEQC